MTAKITEYPHGRGEIVADGIVHAVGLAAAIAGAGVLIAAAVAHGTSVAAVAVYAFALIAMLIFSAAYSLGAHLRFHEVLRRLDYAAIFVMIAGTYTPFTAGVLIGGWAVGLTAAVWAIAALGVVLKTVLAPHGLRNVTTLLYIAFGWIGVVAAQPFMAALSPPVLWLVVAGGVIYTLGTVVYTLQHLPYRRAIWHAFVVAGAAAHFYRDIPDGLVAGLTRAGAPLRLLERDGAVHPVVDAGDAHAGTIGDRDRQRTRMPGGDALQNGLDGVGSGRAGEGLLAAKRHRADHLLIHQDVDALDAEK